MKNNSGYLKAALIGFGALIVTGVVTLFGLVGYNMHRYETAKKETVHAKVTSIQTAIKDGQSVYVIGTDKETFINADDPLKNKFSRANDLQGKIKIDSTYDFNVYGVRSKIFDTYRNILQVTPAPK